MNKKMENGDFFDNDLSELDDNIQSAVEEENNDEIKSFPYVLYLHKSGHNLKKSLFVYFNKQSIKYIDSLFRFSGCFEDYLIVSSHKNLTDLTEFDKYFLEREIEVLFKFKNKFRARDFRKFLLTLMAQDRSYNIICDDYKIGYYADGNSDSKGVVQSKFNFINPEITVACVFFECGFLDKYINEIGYKKLFLEMHRRVIIDPEEYRKYQNENPDEMICFCTSLVDSVHNTWLPGVFAAYPYSEEPNLVIKLDKWIGLNKNLQQIKEALTIGCITYELTRTDDEILYLNWYKKIIVAPAGNFNTFPTTLIIVSITSKKIEKKIDVTNSYSITYKGTNLINGFNSFIYGKKYLTSLFDIYRDCFDKTYVTGNIGNEDDNENEFQIDGYYKLSKSLNIKEFYKFVKEVIEYNKFFPLRTGLNVKFDYPKKEREEVCFLMEKLI